MDHALIALTKTERSCTANFILGQSPRRVVDVELAPEKLRLINPGNAIISHANHFDDQNVIDVSEPPNPRRHLSEYRKKRMESLLHKHKPLNIRCIQEILKDHENLPQSLCRHRDDSLPQSQHTITKTAVIMDLCEKQMWLTNGQPCKSDFEKFDLN